MFVNYKNLHHKSKKDAPDLAHILEDVYINSTMCFPSQHEDMESLDDFIVRIMAYLHPDMDHVDSVSPSPKSSTSPPMKRTKRTIIVHGVKFRSSNGTTLEVDHIPKRWELFVLFDTHRRVDASCLVEFNDIYQTCEIHEVCVATTGKGLCKELITFVRDHIQSGGSGTINRIHIFCKKSNMAACKCYTYVLRNCKQVKTPFTTAFMYDV